MWINSTTGKTFTSHSAIRDAVKASLPAQFTDELLEELGYFPVMPVTQVFNPITQTATELSPANIADVWTQQWEVVELFETQEERDAAIAADTEAKRKAAVPTSVSMRQAELELLDADLLDDIEALIPQLPRADQISWKRASVVERNNPLVAHVQQVNGLTDLAIDQLFINAAKR